MKKSSSLLLFALSTAFIIHIQSCEKSSSNNGETKISQNNENESHNMGQNCMNCHKSGGQGEGIFNIAGTVYDNTKTTAKGNGNIKLYTGPNGSGTLKATIQIDAKGNFYSTETIDFASGLYPVVTGASGDIKYMGSSTSNGQCNSCHGVSNDKIWVN